MPRRGSVSKMQIRRRQKEKEGEKERERVDIFMKARGSALPLYHELLLNVVEFIISLN